MAIKHLDLLRTIVGNLNRIAPPDELLAGQDALQWLQNPQFPYARMTSSGERVGLTREGAVAVIELANFLSAQQPRYRRGTHPKKLATAIADAVIGAFDGMSASSIQERDLARLEADVASWFTRSVRPRRYVIPCSIIPDLASLFVVGPVSFFHVHQLIDREGLHSSNPEEHIVYGPLLRAMRERSASWVAEIEIDDREEDRAAVTADLAVDIALVGVQMIIPVYYSREMARITGRTNPAWIGSVHKEGTIVKTGIHRRDPGFGFSADAFDLFLSKQTHLLESVGRRVEHYVRGSPSCPKLQQAWCDAAYWFHEGLAEPLDTIAIANIETALEVLLGAGSTKKSNERLRQAIRAFYGLSETDPVMPNSLTNVKEFVKSIVGARSRVLHGTGSTLTDNFGNTRANVEAFGFDLLRRSTALLDEYSAMSTSEDNVTKFLDWIGAQRQTNP